MSNSLEKPKFVLRAEMISMIGFLRTELLNLDRFEDSRQLLATYDLKLRYEQVRDAAEKLEDAFNAIEEVQHVGR